jgi:hypothetical protein
MFDPAHLAAQNTRFVGIPGGGNFVNLLNGGVGTLAGTPTSSIDSAVGSFCKFPSTTAVTFANNPATADTNFTIAAILRVPTAAGDYVFENSTNGTGGVALRVASTGNVSVRYVGPGTLATTLSCPAGLPFFVAVSGSGATVLNSVCTHLGTGAIQATTRAGNAIGASNGTYIIGDIDTLAANNSFVNPLGPVMFSANYLSLAQLTQWAQNPWSFWYLVQ